MSKRKAKAPAQRRKITEIAEGILHKKRMKTYGLLAILFVIILIFATGNRGTYKLYQFYSQKQSLTEDVKRLELDESKLNSQKEGLQNDPAYIEKVAREKYKMKKKGERVYEIIEK